MCYGGNADKDCYGVCYGHGAFDDCNVGRENGPESIPFLIGNFLPTLELLKIIKKSEIWKILAGGSIAPCVGISRAKQLDFSTEKNFQPPPPPDARESPKVGNSETKKKVMPESGLGVVHDLNATADGTVYGTVNYVTWWNIDMACNGVCWGNWGTAPNYTDSYMHCGDTWAPARI